MTGRSTALRRGLQIATLALLAVAGCGRLAGDAPPRGGLSLRFEDRPEPGAFTREGTATADAADGAEGLWAAVPGLPRPERALVVNLDSGDEVVVALFRARSGAGIRVSSEAAEALGIGATPARVRITALRSEVSLIQPPVDFDRRRRFPYSPGSAVRRTCRSSLMFPRPLLLLCLALLVAAPAAAFETRPARRW